MVTGDAAVQALSSITGAFFSPSRAYLKEQVAIWCGVFAAIGAAALVSGFLQGYCFTLMGARLTRRIRIILIGCLMKQARARSVPHLVACSLALPKVLNGAHIGACHMHRLR